MNPPKFLCFEELVRDHERLCAEVEELKKAFEGHVHDANGGTRYNDPEFYLGKTHTSEPLKEQVARQIKEQDGEGHSA
jgi:hypothetical protein